MTVNENQFHLRGLVRDGDMLIFRGVPVKEMLAYPIALAAVLVGKSYWTLRREVHLGRLHQSPGAVIAREELDRYLLAGRPAPGTSYAEQRLGEKLPLTLP